MGSFVTNTKMLLAYNNHLTYEHVNQIQLVGCNAVLGHPVTNLLYPDPSLYLLTDTPTAHPHIIFELKASFSFTTVGFYAHSLYQYDAFKVDIGTSMSGPWVTLDSVAIPAVPTDWHPDVLLQSQGGTGTFFRVMWTHTTWTSFRLGGLFFGKGYEVTQNVAPDAGATPYNTRPERAMRAAGGALHRVRGPRWTERRYDMRFNRINQAQMLAMGNILEQAGDDTVGVKGPEQGAVMPTSGIGHFYGHIVDFTPEASQGSGPSDHRYNLSVTLSGNR